jgi:hypothetical protein
MSKRKKRGKQLIASAAKQGRSLVPGVGARTSVDEGNPYAMVFDKFASNLSGLAAKFPFEFYNYLDYLFLKEPYFMRFLHQTVSLGNTGHKLKISASNEKQANEAIQAANSLAARCFPWGGGMDGVASGCLSQMVRAGATCVEWPAAPDFSQVDRAYLNPIKTLRFRRKPDLTLEICQVQLGRLVPLNPAQTTFTAVDMWDDNPNPIPPTISAMRALTKLTKFEDSLDGWLNKLSGLGLLVAQLKTPERNWQDNENEEQYQARTSLYLDDFSRQTMKNLKGGLAAAFDNVDFKHHNTSAGAAGARDILQMVLQSLFAGLGRDPVFMGWNFHSTETYSKVIFEELINGIRKFQLGAKRTMEHGHRLNLALGGLGDVGVSLVFNPNRSLDSFMGAEAKQMEATAVVSEYEAGLIDRDEARQILGITDQAAKAGTFIASFNRAENRYVAQPFRRRTWAGIETQPPLPPLSGGNDTGRTSQSAISAPRIRGIVAKNSKDSSRREAKNAAREYLFDVQAILSEAGKAGVQAVYEWALDHNVPDVDEFTSEALDHYISGAEESIDSEALVALARNHLEKIWKFGRTDPDLFGHDWDKGGKGVGVIFGKADEAALDYMTKKVDRFYVSKYVSNSPVRSRQITNFIADYYLKNGYSRGKDPKDLAPFREKFSDLADRIGNNASRIIVDTACSRSQNWSGMLSLYEYGITEFIIAGPSDRLTCKYCANMLGRVFKVETEYRRIQDITETGEEDIAKFSPFITSRYGTKEGYASLQAASDEEVQAGGQVTPPFHCLCRHRIVANVKTSVENIRQWNARRLFIPVINAGWLKAA